MAAERKYREKSEQEVWVPHAVIDGSSAKVIWLRQDEALPDKDLQKEIEIPDTEVEKLQRLRAKYPHMDIAIGSDGRYIIEGRMVDIAAVEQPLTGQRRRAEGGRRKGATWTGRVVSAGLGLLTGVLGKQALHTYAPDVEEGVRDALKVNPPAVIVPTEPGQENPLTTPAPDSVTPTMTAMPPTVESSPTIQVAPTERPDSSLTPEELNKKYGIERLGLVAVDREGTGQAAVVINLDAAKYDSEFGLNPQRPDAETALVEFATKTHEIIEESINVHKELFPNFEHNDDLWVAPDGKSYSFVTKDGVAHVVKTDQPIIYVITDQKQKYSLDAGNSVDFSSTADGSLVFFLQLGPKSSVADWMISPVEKMSRIQGVTGADQWIVGFSQDVNDPVKDRFNRLGDMYGLLVDQGYPFIEK